MMFWILSILLSCGFPLGENPAATDVKNALTNMKADTLMKLAKKSPSSFSQLNEELLPVATADAVLKLILAAEKSNNDAQTANADSLVNTANLIKQASDSIAGKEMEIEDLKNDKFQLIDDCGLLNHELDVLEDTLIELHDKEHRLQSDVADLSNEMSTIQSLEKYVNALASSDAASLPDELETGTMELIRKALDETGDDLNTAQASLTDTYHSIDETTDAIMTKEWEIEQCKRDQEQLEQHLQQLLADLAALEHGMATLRKEMTSLEAVKVNLDAELVSILSLKKSLLALTVQWVIGGAGQNCIDACDLVGKACSGDMLWPQSQSYVQDAAKAAGVTCESSVERCDMGESPLYGGGEGKGAVCTWCANVEHPGWSMVPADPAQLCRRGWGERTRLCPCTAE